MAASCLVVGLGIGFLSRGLQGSASRAIAVAPASTLRSAARRVPTLDGMKQMADKRAAPLLDKLKSNPKDSGLLMEVAAIYHSSHQFKEAAAYYDKALEDEPKNVALRTKLASSVYRSVD